MTEELHSISWGASEPAAIVEDLPDEYADFEDLDPAEWLKRDDSQKTDYVIIGDRRMKVGILVQGEWEKIEAESRAPGVGRVNPANPKTRLRNTNWFARRIVAFAINKGAGREIVKPEDLLNKSTGELIAIQKTILRLSGIEEESEDVFA